MDSKVYFIFVHSHGFIPEGIQICEIIQDICENDYKKHEVIVNHAATKLVDENGQYVVVEMVEEGCVKQLWEESRYYKNEVAYFVCEWVPEFSPKERLDIIIQTLKDVGKSYWYFGILCQMVWIFSFKKLWLGKKGDRPKEEYTCAMQCATNINLARKGAIKDPSKYNPQMLFERPEMRIVAANFKPAVIDK